MHFLDLKFWEHFFWWGGGGDTLNIVHLRKFYIRFHVNGVTYSKLAPTKRKFSFHKNGTNTQIKNALKFPIWTLKSTASECPFRHKILTHANPDYVIHLLTLIKPLIMIISMIIKAVALNISITLTGRASLTKRPLAYNYKHN